MALDLLGWISPRRAAERDVWREYRKYQRELFERGGYDAGDYSRLNRHWHARNESAEMTDRMDRDKVRARARDAERNIDMANAVLSAFRRNIVGRGFSVQARTGSRPLDAQIEGLWKEWCRPRNCDVTGTQSFMQMVRMAVDRKKVDGGILFLKVYTLGGLLPFKLQAIEVDELAGYQTEPKHKGNKVCGGIEYNEYNRAMGYWIVQYSLDGISLPEPKYYPAKDVIFLFTKRRPSQVREMSDLSSVLERIRDANEFADAVTSKQRIAACLGVFITKQNPKDGPPSFGGRNMRPGADGDGKQKYANKKLEPGMMMELGLGEGIEVVNPSGVSNDAGEFLKLLQGMYGSGAGISYESVSRDLSRVTYSSARQGAIEDELTYAEEIELLVVSLLSEVYETFVISAVLAGLLPIPDFWEHKAQYLKHEWVESPKKWIDPYKEARATEVAVNTGQKTFKQISAEVGRDWQEQIDDMAEVAAYAASKNIQMGGVTFGAKQKRPAKRRTVQARVRHACAGG